MFEDGIAKPLEGDNLRNALDFAAWLRANKFTPSWASWNCYKVNINGKCVCGIHLGCGEVIPDMWLTNYWHLGLGHRLFNHDNTSLSDREKEIVWSNLKICNGCGAGCWPGHPRTYFGKKFERVCGAGVEFWNPGAEEMEVAKKLFLMKREYDKNKKTVESQNKRA